jgi:hypothetical protein
MGRGENNRGKRAVAERFDHFEPGELRHLHIEEKQIGAQFAHGLQCFRAIHAFADDLDFGLFGQEGPDAFARERFVVGNDDADFHDAVESGEWPALEMVRSGISRLTRTPRPSPLREPISSL